jgi:hypothetical protein
MHGWLYGLSNSNKNANTCNQPREAMQMMNTLVVAKTMNTCFLLIVEPQPCPALYLHYCLKEQPIPSKMITALRK